MFSESARTSTLVLCILSIVGFAVYANSLDVPFYLDDFRNISENRFVRIDSVSLTTLYDAAFNSPLATRPVSNVSFAINYFLHQESVLGYHLVNTAIHVLTGFILYLLFSITFSTPALSLKYKNVHLVSFLASLLWLVHPLHTGSVVYIVQRMVILATMFYVLALLCYAKGRMSHSSRAQWGWMSISAISAFFALASKEIALTLPFVIFLYEWYFFQDVDRKWLRAKLWLVGAFIVFIGISYVVYAGSFEAFLSAYEKRPFTMEERVYTEFRVVLLYLSFLVFPDPGRLNLDHHISLSTSLFDPITTALSAGAIVLALLLSVALAKKQRILSFAILWYLGNLVMESSFLGLELVFEHRTYLPSIFVILAFTLLLNDFVRPRQFAVGLTVAAIALCSYWTIERNKMWRDPVLFWSDSVAKSPEKPRPYINLSVALRERGYVDEAINASKKAISLDPRFVNAYVGLGFAYAEKGDVENAEAQYLAALELMPDYTDVYNALGVLYAKQGMTRKAVAAFNENLRHDPTNIEALVNRASIMAYQGNFVGAIADFHQALEVGGNNPDILFNLATAYAAKGDIDKAIHTLEEVLQLNPDDRQALANLQQLRSKLTR